MMAMMMKVLALSIAIFATNLHTMQSSSFNYVDYPRNHLQDKSEVVSPPPFRVGVPCSAEETARLGKEFQRLQHDNTHCPQEREWLFQMAVNDVVGSKLLVNVGLNKGYTIASWLAAFTPWNQVTPLIWQEHLLEVRPELEESCGPCKDCEKVFPSQNFKRFLTIPHVTILAIDVNPHEIVTVEEIMKGIEGSTRSQHLGVSMFTSVTGLGETIGDLYIPQCYTLEDDCGTVKHKDIIESNNMLYTSVESVTFDHLMIEFKTSYRKFFRNRGYTFHEYNGTQRKPKEVYPKIDILSMDMDGYDGMAIKGAFGQLSGRNIRCLMFEYHYLPPWRNMKLEDIVIKLDSFGYDCYLKGSGRLWKMTACFSADYEFHGMGNIMCILRGDIWHDVVQQYVQE